ncbi:MAG: hypothetical protein QM760_04505 [Nibricoccus sp.]
MSRSPKRLFFTSFWIVPIIVATCLAALALVSQSRRPSFARAHMTELSPASFAESPDAISGPISRSFESARLLNKQLSVADPDDQGDRFLERVIALAQQGSLDAALALAERSPSETRTETLAIVFRIAAERSSETARELAALLCETQPDALFADVLQSWARAQPSQVAEFALTLPQGETRSLAFFSALDPWLQRDPARAAGWIARLENSAERDAALCRWLLKTDPLHRPSAAAVQQALTITDSTLRVQATAHILNEWIVSDAAAARRFVETAPGFTGEQRTTLFAALTPLPTDCPSPP